MPDNKAEFKPMTTEEIGRAHVTELVPLTGLIELADYDPDWPSLFDREQTRIRSVLDDKVVMIEHVGSTSVPGLAAKPRIDILLVVHDSADEAAYATFLKASGYVLCIREPEWYEHRLFKGPDIDINLHVFSPECVEIGRMLSFRDWLRTHPEDREIYEQSKRKLAARQWEYTQNYADAKTAVVEEIIARAAASGGS